MATLTFMLEEPEWVLSSLNLKRLALEFDLHLNLERIQDSRFPSEAIVGTVIGSDENVAAFEDALEEAKRVTMADWDYVLDAKNRHIYTREHNLRGRCFLLQGVKPKPFLRLLRPSSPNDSLPIETFNQADYYAAICAVEAFLDDLTFRKIDSHNLKVQICTSKLVANQVMGKWRVNDSVLFMLCAKVRALLSEFGEWEAVCKEDV